MCKSTHSRCSAPPIGPLHFTLPTPLISSMMPKQWEQCGVPFIQSTSISQKLLYCLPHNLQYASCAGMHVQTHTHTCAHTLSLPSAPQHIAASRLRGGRQAMWQSKSRKWLFILSFLLRTMLPVLVPCSVFLYSDGRPLQKTGLIAAHLGFSM